MAEAPQNSQHTVGAHVRWSALPSCTGTIVDRTHSASGALQMCLVAWTDATRDSR